MSLLPVNTFPFTQAFFCETIKTVLSSLDMKIKYSADITVYYRDVREVK